MVKLKCPFCRTLALKAGASGPSKKCRNFAGLEYADCRLEPSTELNLPMAAAESEELYELVSSPSTQQLANCARVVLAYAGVPAAAVRDAVLDGAALQEYIEGARSGTHLPAFVDFAKRVELNRPLALLRYVARIGGIDGSAPADADRAALVAEAVVAFVQAGLVERDGAISEASRFFVELEGLYTQSAGSGIRLTYSDALLWYAASAATRAFGPGVLDAARGLSALIGALGRDARIATAARVLGWGDATPISRPVRSAAAVKGPVLVTGAGGFIASWVVATLLGRGYTVHATVRRLSDPARHAHLLALPGAEAGRLRLFEADLLSPGSFRDAVAGCTGVLHCASPFFFTPRADAYEELIRPAVEGTRNVLRACIAEESVQRVVMTSSVGEGEGRCSYFSSFSRKILAGLFCLRSQRRATSAVRDQTIGTRRRTG